MTELPSDLFHQLRRRVRIQPHACAIDDGSLKLSYQELFDAALAVASAIIKTLGAARPEQPQAVGLLMDHGANAILGQLACIFAGRCYVPLDPLFPRKRLQQYLKQAEVECVLSQGHHINLAQQLIDPDIALLALEDIDYTKRANIIRLDPSLPAYLLYTSGSTGEPKGIWHDQRSLLRSVKQYQNDLQVNSTDRIALVLPLQYTPSVFCVFGGLLAGATVCPFDLRRNSIESMLHWLQQSRITLLYATPTIFRRYMQLVHTNTDFSHLRSVQLAGEPVYRSDLENYFAGFAAHFSLYNGMGTTETSCLTRYFITSLEDFAGDIVPIGKPYDDVNVLIVKETGQPRSKDAFCDNGEMLVQSSYLARGYWRNAALTEQSFTYDPNTARRQYMTGDIVSRDHCGNLIYHGRRDSQVKVQGKRVELSEIESTLLKLSSVQEAVVLFNETAHPPLSAFITPSQALDPIRQSLASTLPIYMIPTRLVALDSLPTNPSGKIDRALLTDLPVQQSPVDSEPPNTEQMIVITAFRKALENSDVSIDDDFFALGGDSLSATVLTLELAREGYTIDASNLIEAPTPRKLTQTLIIEPSKSSAGIYQFSLNPDSTQATQSLFIFPGQGVGPVSFAKLVAGINRSKSVFAFDFETMLASKTKNDQININELAQACVQLILDVTALATQPQSRVLLGFSLGGLVAMEVARQLEELGQPIEQLILLDSYSPKSMQIRYLKRRYGRRALFGLRGKHQDRTWRRLTKPGSVTHALEQAVFKYRPQSLKIARLSLIKASERRPALPFFDDYSQWRHLIDGKYQEVIIIGDHNDLIRSNKTKLVAAQLNQWLDGVADS